jgi:hypothetical protein
MVLHIANTNFEWELTQKQIPELITSLKRNPIFLQLQFLPFLYGAPDDLVAVTAEPPDVFWRELDRLGIKPPKLHLLSAPPPVQVESWGASRAVAAWAGHHYAMPPWEVVRAVHSKEFSFTRSPKLPGSMLLRQEEEARAFFAVSKKPFVLKTCFGLSGQGHLIVGDAVEEARVLQFLKAEWQQGLPVIAEPWVERMLDFSTQWELSQTGEITYLGATICENDAKGRYLQNKVGEITIPHLEEHKRIARPILEEMIALGYFGNVGIDAMVYGVSHTLHPIVEINARKTMGWVALEVQRRHFPHQTLTLSYAKNSAVGLLPSSLGDTLFTRQLMVFT